MSLRAPIGRFPRSRVTGPASWSRRDALRLAACGGAAALAGCARGRTASDDDSEPAAETPAQLKGRVLQQVGTFDFDRRLAQYTAIKQLTDALRGSPSQVLVQDQYIAWQEFPLLTLSSHSGDGNPDFYTLRRASPGSQDEVVSGFFFDLNRDGLTDYITYELGSAPADPAAKDAPPVFSAIHFISSRGDGRIDIEVDDLIDIGLRGQADHGVSAWIYGRNPQGLIEDAEYLGPTMQQRFPVPVANGQLQIAWLLPQVHPPFTVWTQRHGWLVFAMIMGAIDNTRRAVAAPPPAQPSP
jgi:hypothetical protein